VEPELGERRRAADQELALGAGDEARRVALATNRAIDEAHPEPLAADVLPAGNVAERGLVRQHRLRERSDIREATVLADREERRMAPERPDAEPAQQCGGQCRAHAPN